jgi:hypothetical protein
VQLIQRRYRVWVWRSGDSAQSFEIIEYPDYGARNTIDEDFESN